jgi:excinuclease ABC subunit C
MTATDLNENVRNALERLPAEPGVYQMLDERGDVLYVGKAIDLRSRVRSYFQPGRPHVARTDAMVELVRDIRTIIVANDTEALLLESNLIKQHRPPFNIRLKDDKSYPHLKLTMGERFPRLIFTRKLIDDGGRYFGPYTNAAALREVIEIVRRAFPLRTCTGEIGVTYRRPCLQYHIKRCMAPCAFLQTEPEYDAIVAEVALFLEGRFEALISRIEREMQKASDDMAYEQAARLRDRLADLHRVMARQAVVWRSRIDMDVVAAAHGQGVSCVEVFFVRAGLLVGQESSIVEGTEGRGPDEVLAEFVQQYYARAPKIPKEIMVEARIPDREAVERALSGKRGNRVRILAPERGPRAEYLRKVRRNAEQHLADHLTRTAIADERASVALDEIAAALNLPTQPRRIECYDISHVQGTDVVGSMVVFEDGRSRKADYRRFKIQGDGNDDFANMAQMLRRRLRYLNEPAGGKEKKFARRPDLLLIDGGRGQLNAALEILRELDLIAIPVAALAKQFEELYLPGEAEPVLLAANSPAMHLVQRIRDEAHRFAVTYHRTLRGKRQIASPLDAVPGVGAARKKALLRKFGSASGVRRASEEQLRTVPGISASVAHSIKEALNT